MEDELVFALLESCWRMNSSELRSVEIVDSSDASASLRFSAGGVDFALDVLEARLRLLQHQIGRDLGLAHQALGFLFGVVPDLVGELLRGEQRVAQVALVVAQLLERRLAAGNSP